MGEGWPVMGTTLVVGTTFGVVARQAGLEPLEIVAMSLLVFAGASQFAMVQLFAESAPTPIVIASVLFINLRHLLMATSLGPQLQRLPLARRLFAAFFLTDESFAMATGHFRRGGRSVAYYFTFAIALFVLWNLATVGGIVLGGAIGDPGRFGVDFAITATFIGIVVLAIRRTADIAIALVAALVAGGLALAGASTIAVITAGALAPLIAVLARR
jgi:4-azaleucine resistance transporter AzlC